MTYEKQWKASGQMVEAPSPAALVFDAIYYLFPAVIVRGLAISAFIAFVGHPGAFGGAGAHAVW